VGASTCVARTQLPPRPIFLLNPLPALHWLRDCDLPGFAPAPGDWHFVGYANAPTGLLREIGCQADVVTANIAL
jgi:hypothetical protein